MKSIHPVRNKIWFVYCPLKDSLATINAISQSQAADLFFKANTLKIQVSNLKNNTFIVTFKNSLNRSVFFATLEVTSHPPTNTNLLQQLISRFRYEVINSSSSLPVSILSIFSYVSIYFKVRV
jgi:hypothetical protein